MADSIFCQHLTVKYNFCWWIWKTRMLRQCATDLQHQHTQIHSRITSIRTTKPPMAPPMMYGVIDWGSGRRNKVKVTMESQSRNPTNNLICACLERTFMIKSSHHVFYYFTLIVIGIIIKIINWYWMNKKIIKISSIKVVQKLNMDQNKIWPEFLEIFIDIQILKTCTCKSIWNYCNEDRHVTGKTNSWSKT